ncbi:hypothetical protein ACFL3B_03445 [Gemmatimonadota bacterium]
MTDIGARLEQRKAELLKEIEKAAQTVLEKDEKKPAGQAFGEGARDAAWFACGEGEEGSQRLGRDTSKQHLQSKL